MFKKPLNHSTETSVAAQVAPRKFSRRPRLSIAIAGLALFVALGGTAVANSLIHAGDISKGAVTSKAIKNGTIKPKDLHKSTRSLFGGGLAGVKGETGLTGASGENGTPGTSGTNGANGANGPNGANGANGANGPNGVDGIDGTNGANGTNGTNGTDGTDGTIEPLSATAGLTLLPTATPPTVVVSMLIPAGNYVVLAKTQLSHSGAGDSIDCWLKEGLTNIDRVAMKTMAALAAMPVSMQAVISTVSPSQLSVECDVSVANGDANFSSLIAIPTA